MHCCLTIEIVFTRTRHNVTLYLHFLPFFILQRVTLDALHEVSGAMWKLVQPLRRQTSVGGKMGNSVNILFFCAEQVLNYSAK